MKYLSLWLGRICLLVVMLPSTGCAGRLASAPPPSAPLRPAVLPPLPAGRLIEPGVLFYEVNLPRGDASSKLWIYLPQKASGKLPLILIGPAGTRLFHGIGLGDGDRPEHLPYARAGFAVVAYELDGSLPDSPSNDEIVEAARKFKDTGAGLENARTALDYALARVPNIDPHRIYTAGHSSAATLSLLVAEHEPRIAACVAYAPVTDLVGRLGDRFIAIMSLAIPGYRDFIEQSSPMTGVAQLHCPVFLFHTDDDSNVPTREVTNFAAALSRTNPHVTLIRVATGDHYDSMIQEGIPRAIRWLRSLGDDRR